MGSNLIREAASPTAYCLPVEQRVVLCFAESCVLTASVSAAGGENAGRVERSAIVAFGYLWLFAMRAYACVGALCVLPRGAWRTRRYSAMIDETAEDSGELARSG